MDHIIKECINLEKSKEKENLNGQIIHNLMDNLIIIIFKDMVLTHGWTVGNMKDFGKKIKCMEKESFIGLIEENTKDNISMIKNKVMEFLHGQTIKSIKDIG